MGPASRVAPLDKLSVPLVMVFAWLLLGEKLNAMAVVGGVLITAGAIVMVMGLKRGRKLPILNRERCTDAAATQRPYTGTN